MCPQLNVLLTTEQFLSNNENLLHVGGPVNSDVSSTRLYVCIFMESEQERRLH